MSLRNQRRELHGVVGALGVAATLGGIASGRYSPAITIVVIFSVIAVGAAFVSVPTERAGSQS